MTVTASISELRKNLSDYLAKVEQGIVVIIKDEKKDEEIAQLTKKEKFNKNEYLKALEDASVAIASNSHPEWKDQKSIIKWLRQSRKDRDIPI
jgi:antitoxin (DNA-binding transcriptional repressor) of toxin-antitoxin stability system